MSGIMDCSTDENRERAITAAVNVVKAGWLVVMPTDTAHGLGCDASDNQVVASLLRARHRGPDMLVPVLVGSWSTIKGLVREYPPVARALVETFWPGGLSLVVNQAPGLPRNLGDTAGTAMLRMSLYSAAIEILRRIGPMAVSSANIPGQVPTTNAMCAKQMLGGEAVVYVDGGEATIGTPSIIVDIPTPVPRILREGAVSVAAVAEVLSIMPERLLGQQPWPLKVFPVQYLQ